MEKNIKNTYTINITDEDVVKNLEKLSFETDRNKELLDGLKSTDSLNETYYKLIYDKYMEASYNFEIAKRNFVNEYLADFVKHEVDWDLDFYNKTVIIKQYCDCDIDNATPNKIETCSCAKWN